MKTSILFLTVMLAATIASADNLNSQFISANKLIGQDIQDNTGQKVGEIENVFINKDNGEIAYTLVGRGGIMGMGEDLVVVPWQSLQATKGQDGLQLRVSNVDLSQAPTIENADSDRLYDSTWLQDNFRYYNADPVWNQRQSSTSERNRGY